MTNNKNQHPQLTGAEIIWATLAGEGVDKVFGYPGGAILPAYDALRKFPIHHILVRHEQGAAHMADGYARASGKVGVCIATSGPGATNLVTGIATAMLDSIPIMPSESEWCVGMPPRPRSVLATGICWRSAKARTWASAPECVMPWPARMMGFFAALMSSMACWMEEDSARSIGCGR